MGFLDPFFDITMGPLLNLPPILAILIVSFVLSLFIVLIYKWLTNQNEMKRLKDELKSFQEKMRNSKDNPEKLLKIQKEAMSLNMTYMRKSMKPTFVTFIPIILIFGWLNAHFAYAPLLPNEPFDVSVLAQEGVTGNVTLIAPEEFSTETTTASFKDGKATFTLRGPKGEYLLTFKSGGEEVDKDVLITDKRAYAPVQELYKGGVFKAVEVHNEQLKVIWGLTWIWAYIIFAILSSVILRKALKVY